MQLQSGGREFPVRTTIDPAPPHRCSLQSAGTPLEAHQWRFNGLPQSVGSCRLTNAGSLPAGRLYMTGDLRALTGLPRTHMDFYLREGIIQPTTRTGSGYLLFDHAELETLRAVLRWREEGSGSARSGTASDVQRVTERIRMHRCGGTIRPRRRRETIATLTGGQLPGSDVRGVQVSETICLPTPDSRT